VIRSEPGSALAAAAEAGELSKCQHYRERRRHVCRAGHFGDQPLPTGIAVSFATNPSSTGTAVTISVDAGVPRGAYVFEATGLEPVINFRAGSVARENRARRGGGRRLWRPHCGARQRSMARFSPQPEGLGPIFLISLSLVARRFPIFVTPRFANWENWLPAPPVGKL